MNRYLVILERTATGWSAYCPEIPGCVAAGRTRRDTCRLMRAALALHLQAEPGHSQERAARPRSQPAYVTVPV